jgi:uncharacterized protein YifN (PemK superfamily)
MKNFASVTDISTINREDALPANVNCNSIQKNSTNSLSHANPKDRYLSCKVLDGIPTHSGIGLWMSWPRTDHQLCRLESNELFQCDFVISINCSCCAFKDKVLVDVPGERVIIVYHNKIRGIG